MAEDLGIKLVDKELVFWETERENLEKAIDNGAKTIEIQKHLLKFVEKKLK